MFHRKLFCSAVLAFGLLSGVFADQLDIKLSSFPSMSVADGRSTAQITAYVRDATGRSVPDGTRVIFATTIGTFRESVVTTVGGVARATLVAGGNAGVAAITVTALRGDSSPVTLTYEFVGDKSLLSSAKEYVEIVSGNALSYAADTRKIEAASPAQGVALRYRDISIDADAVQLNIPSYVLRAKNAKMRIGKVVHVYSDLFFNLKQRKGFGTTTFSAYRVEAILPSGGGLAFAAQTQTGDYQAAQPEDRFGVVEIEGPTIKPGRSPMGSPIFNFEDLSGSPSTITAKKVVIFPQKGVQFQKAEIMVGGARVMKLPLFELSFLASSSPLVTDQMVNVNNNQLAVNYPYYLSLKPGQTSLLRFRTGERLGRGVGGSGGAFLDYELNWNRGDQMEGGLTVSGLARNDWSIGARHFIRFDDRTTGFAQVDIPSGRSISGSSSVGRQFDGFQVNMSGSMTRSLRGIKYSAQDYSMIAEKDPTKVGQLPVRLYYGLTATSSTNDLVGRSQHNVGLRLRGQSLQLPIDSSTSLTSSFSVSRFASNSSGPNMAFSGNITLSKRLSSTASLVGIYDYTKDGFNDSILGQHRLSLQSYYNSGRTNISIFASKSLDVDRLSYFGDLSYGLSRMWRLSSAYTLDRYKSDTYLDYTMGLGYQIGWREVGLVWSKATKRIGFQVLGATVY